MKPNIIRRDKLLIAGTHGDGNNTGAVWGELMKLCEATPLTNALSQNGYEIRVYDGTQCTVHVGYPVSSNELQPGYSLMELPAAKYASFDVYVANGYDSENTAMDEWLKTNDDGWHERLLNDTAHYCIEYYDERFNGDEANSIVEIWVPIEKA